MKKLVYLFILVLMIVACSNNSSNTCCMKGGEMFKTTHVKEDNSKKLAILWTSGDPEVAIKMVMMYAYNIQKAKKWDDMVFIIWGPSSKLAANNSKIQEYLKKMKNIGIRLEACKACSDSYGVSEKLSNLGIDVKYMGIPLTKYIQSGWKTITF